ncbi:hypothetical protein EDB85DRAFT_1947683 [Lactarius pseudohatsudake]|nr:hypothetical protein EDB85DRAFT_1947683 [Lactarius pseudohatsudake]
MRHLIFFFIWKLTLVLNVAASECECSITPFATSTLLCHTSSSLITPWVGAVLELTYLTPFQALPLPGLLILFIYTFDPKVRMRGAEPVGPPNSSKCTRCEARATCTLSGSLHTCCEFYHHTSAHLGHQPVTDQPIPVAFAGQRLAEAIQEIKQETPRSPKSGKSGTDQKKKDPAISHLTNSLYFEEGCQKTRIWPQLFG